MLILFNPVFPDLVRIQRKIKTETGSYHAPEFTLTG